MYIARVCVCVCEESPACSDESNLFVIASSFGVEDANQHKIASLDFRRNLLEEEIGWQEQEENWRRASRR